MGVFRVYDMCGHTEASFREGADFGSVVYRYGYDTARRFHRGCSQSRFMAVVRSAWIDNERKYFRWRNQAERWVAERRDEHYRARTSAEREGQPVNTAVYGFYDSVERNFGGSISGGPFGIMFAPRDAPVDEVRVLVGSVAVSGGVLRGLVRNWSRHLWAYGVTVSAGEGSFRWPLSVQPGELAPFEIAGWEGPDDPGLVDIVIDAEMSWHADPSRAWGESSAPSWHFLVSDVARRPLRDSVRERYAHVTADVAAGSVSVESLRLEAPLAAPASHLSLRGLKEDIVVGDLRGYGAVLDGAGRVVDVGAAPTVGRNDWDEEITSLPHPLAMNYSSPRLVAGVGIQFDIHAIHEGMVVDGEPVIWAGGDFIIWIGAAFPSRPVG